LRYIVLDWRARRQPREDPTDPVLLTEVCGALAQAGSDAVGAASWMARAHAPPDRTLLLRQSLETARAVGGPLWALYLAGGIGILDVAAALGLRVLEARAQEARFLRRLRAELG